LWGSSGEAAAAGGRDSSASDVIVSGPRAASSSTSPASSAERAYSSTSMWITICSPSCLWNRTCVKNSRVPWSPNAPNASESAASGPEQLSTCSASTVTVHDATQGVPAIIRSQRSSTASILLIRRPFSS
jgi:hypothetical protein